MSREIDPNNMSELDVAYVRQRPLLRQEFIMQGLGDPLDPEYPGLNFTPEGSESDEQREAREEQEEAKRLLAEAEQKEREAREAAEREVEAAAQAEADELSKPEAAEAEQAAAETGDAGFEDLVESKRWTKSMNNAELEAVINARNADYDDDEKIEVVGSGKNGKVTKDDLVAALEQDDRELAGEE